MADTNTTGTYQTYKGKSLVRCGNEIYYGSMADKYIIHMMILASNKVNNVDVPSSIMVQLMYTDPDIRLKDRIIKTSNKDSFFKAIEIGNVWLERALAGKK